MAVAELRDEKAIYYKGQKIVVRDVEALEGVAGMKMAQMRGVRA